MTKPKGRLLELDCLRGVAAILVVFFHFTLGQPNMTYKWIFKGGCTGVELFFMISGFVIFLTIEKTSSYKTFLVSRFARLFPAYWICVTLTTLFFITWLLATRQAIVFPGLKDYLFNLTMIQRFFDINNIDGVYWTLLVELLFYAFILVMYLLNKLQHTELIGFLGVIACLINSLVLKSVAPSFNAFSINYVPIVMFFPLFVAGIVFYKIKFYKPNVYRYLLLAFCLITEIVLFKDTGRSIFITQTQYAIILTFYFITFFLYVIGHLHFIVNRVTLFTGKISYSLYLIHNAIGTLLITILTSSHIIRINFWIAVFFVVLPLVTVIATLVNKYIEVPAMNYIKKGVKKPRLSVEPLI